MEYDRACVLSSKMLTMISIEFIVDFAEAEAPSSAICVVYFKEYARCAGGFVNHSYLCKPVIYTHTKVLFYNAPNTALDSRQSRSLEDCHESTIVVGLKLVRLYVLILHKVYKGKE